MVLFGKILPIISYNTLLTTLINALSQERI